MPTPSLLIVPARFKSGKLYSQIPTSGAGDFTVTRATSATRVNASGFIESVASGIPRLDYFASGGTVGCPALLVEPSGSNLALRSDEFRTIAEGGPSNSWTANDTVIISVNNLSPDGTNNATRIRGATTPTNRARQQIITGTSGVVYVGSAWIRRVSGTSPITLRVGDAGSTTNISPTSTWQRFSFSSTPTTTTVRIAFVFPNDTDEFEIWGAQLETGSVATSYIPTTTAAVTRGAETISKTGISSLIGQTEGTIYAEVVLSRVNSNQIISLGSINDRIAIFFDSSTGIYALIRVGATNADYNATIPAIPATGGVYKMALAYKANDYCFAVNGVAYNPSTATRGVPANMSAVYLGASVFSTGQLNDRIRAYALYTTRLSNAQLAALTSP